MSNGDVVKQRMDWQAMMARDRQQPGRLPSNIAMVLVAKYFNSESGKTLAWPP
jgi:hypothetical protein